MNTVVKMHNIKRPIQVNKWLGLRRITKYKQV